jgi:RNA polymerase sigma factor (TIGR02999 family)
MPPIKPSRTSATGLLLAWRGGNDAALGELVSVVQPELQRIARRCMKGQPVNHSLQATALVNEAYMRLVDVREMNWQNRAHFLAMAARLMRRVLVDSARTRGSQKRGGGALRVSFCEDLAVTDEATADVIALSDALDALTQMDDRKSRVVELRYFGGLSVAETAAVLEVSEETVARDWRFARAWLKRTIKHGQP